jgi:hypothetical protein
VAKKIWVNIMNVRGVVRPIASDASSTTVDVSDARTGRTFTIIADHTTEIMKGGTSLQHRDLWDMPVTSIQVIGLRLPSGTIRATRIFA